MRKDITSPCGCMGRGGARVKEGGKGDEVRGEGKGEKDEEES